MDDPEDRVFIWPDDDDPDEPVAWVVRAFLGLLLAGLAMFSGAPWYLAVAGAALFYGWIGIEMTHYQRRRAERKRTRRSHGDER